MITECEEPVKEFWNPFQLRDGDHVLEIALDAIETPVVHMEPEWIVVETQSSVRRFSVPVDSMIHQATAIVVGGRLRIAIPRLTVRPLYIVPTVLAS